VEYKTDTHQVLTIDKSAFPDMREIEAEDKENDEKGGLLRFAFSVQVNSSMEGIRFLANLA
jgi:hypothetical protein